MSPRIFITCLFAVSVASGFTCQGAGVVLYHEPVATYVELVRFNVYAQDSAYFATVTEPNGDQRRLWNEGIVAKIDVPVVGQEIDPATAQKQIKLIQSLYPKYPDYHSQLGQLLTAWQNALAVQKSRIAAATPAAAPVPTTAPVSTSNLPTLNVKGVQYDEVKLTNIQGDSVSITYSAGVTTIPLKVLTKEEIVILNKTSSEVQIPDNWDIRPVVNQPEREPPEPLSAADAPQQARTGETDAASTTKEKDVLAALTKYGKIFKPSDDEAWMQADGASAYEINSLGGPGATVHAVFTTNVEALGIKAPPATWLLLIEMPHWGADSVADKVLWRSNCSWFIKKMTNEDIGEITDEMGKSREGVVKHGWYFAPASSDGVNVLGIGEPGSIKNLQNKNDSVEYSSEPTPENEQPKMTPALTESKSDAPQALAPNEEVIKEREKEFKNHLDGNDIVSQGPTILPNGGEWGMTTEQVRRLYPSAKSVKGSDSKDQELSECNIGGDLYDIRFCFDTMGKLYRIEGTYHQIGLYEQNAPIYSKLQNVFTRKFGKADPEYRSSYGDWREYRWRSDVAHSELKLDHMEAIDLWQATFKIENPKADKAIRNIYYE